MENITKDAHGLETILAEEGGLLLSETGAEWEVRVSRRDDSYDTPSRTVYAESTFYELVDPAGKVVADSDYIEEIAREAVEYNLHHDSEY